MAKILEMPKLSPTMEDGVLAVWHKKEGDSVDVDDVLAEVETDKATMEFRAFDKGTLLKLLVTPGATVRLGQPVAILGKPGEDISALGSADPPKGPPHPPEPAADEAPKGGAVKGAPPAEPPPNEDAAPAAPPPKATPKTNLLDRTSHEPPQKPAAAGRVLASPYVRKIARERGIDLHGKAGSGPGGRLVASDLDAVDRAPSTSLAPAKSDAAGSAATTLLAPESRPLSPMRKAIARRLTEAKQTVPHFYLTADFDAGPLVALREQVNRELATGEGGPHAEAKDAPSAPRVSLNDFVIKACALALRRVPECNAQFSAADAAILVHRRVDISVAVAVSEGLMTPVVRNADQKSVVAIAGDVRELAARARAKKLRPEEMQDGTFSISNLGMFGIDHFAAVINPPEGAILAVGRVREEPVVRDGAIAVGKRMTVTLSCDHRVVDGAIGAAFLAELRTLVEHPMRVLAG